MRSINFGTLRDSSPKQSQEFSLSQSRPIRHKSLGLLWLGQKFLGIRFSFLNWTYKDFYDKLYILYKYPYFHVNLPNLMRYSYHIKKIRQSHIILGVFTFTVWPEYFFLGNSQKLICSNQTKRKNDLLKFNWNSSSSLKRVKWKSFVLVTGKLEVRKVWYLEKIIKI